MWPADSLKNRTRTAAPRRTPTRSFLESRIKHRETPKPCGHSQTARICLKRRQGRWGREEGERERGWTQRASGAGVYSSPSRCAQAPEAIFGAFSKLEARKTALHLTHLCVPVCWWCSCRLVGNGGGGKWLLQVEEGGGFVPRVWPSPSLLLVLVIRYSSAETGGASDETIFLPPFSLSGDTTEEAERGPRKRKSADEQISLSLSLSLLLPSGAPREFRLHFSLRFHHGSHVTRFVAPSMMRPEQTVATQLLLCCELFYNETFDFTQHAMTWSFNDYFKYLHV